jgi:hypothetical protein
LHKLNKTLASALGMCMSDLIVFADDRSWQHPSFISRAGRNNARETLRAMETMGLGGIVVLE